MPTLKIYPPIGVARIGNSQEFFVGPEIPGIPANWDSDAKRFKPFKDKDGKVLRQAARFRIFQLDDAGNPLQEINLSNGFKIRWTANVANRKASFFSFNGQSGARDGGTLPYVNRMPGTKAPDAVEKEFFGRGEPEIKNRRNASVADRRSLEIVPGEVSISDVSSSDLVDKDSKTPINFLGQIQMEASGNLLFFGGVGKTEKLPGAAPLEEYANNDGWFDDMCDGSINATVTFPNGHTETAEQAWVIVGPPDFAPGIGNVVSLYDTIADLVVRTPLALTPGNDEDLLDLAQQQKAWQPATNDFAPTYKPSFTKYIYPILARALAAFDVHQITTRKDFHTTLMDWVKFSDPKEDKRRTGIFSRMRDPNSTTLDRFNMPRGLGDDYTTLDDSESDPSITPSSRAFLSLTRVQYALMKAWYQGNFVPDWQFGLVKYAPIPDPTAVTPHGLTTAALENCVGGPFFPGIEVSWLIRETGLYASAFRLNPTGIQIGVLTFQPGFFSQQMALPWQADFYDCQKEEHTPKGAPEKIFYMWWTAQRPDDIRPDAKSPWRRWVLPFDPHHDPNTNPDDIQNLSRFEQMRTRWSELSFVVLEGDEHVEQK